MENKIEQIRNDLIHKMLNGIDIPALIVKRDHYILFQNKAAEKLFHSRIGGLCWKELWKGEFLPDEQKKLFKENKILPDMQCYFCASDQVLNTQKTIKKEIHPRSKYFESYWVPIDDDTYLHYFVDITSYNEKEKELKNANKFLKTITDIVPDFIWAKDKKGRFIFINKSNAEKLFFAKPEDVTGKTDLYFANKIRKEKPDDSNYYTFGELCINSDKKVLKTKKPGRFDECGNVRGKHLCLDVIKVPWFDENGRLIGTVGAARDVTKQKLNEKKIKEQQKEIERSLEYHKAIFENNAASIIIVDENRVIVDVNPALCKALGYSKNELIGKNAMLIHIDETSYERFGNVFFNMLKKQNVPANVEYSFRRKEGSVLYAEVTGSIITLQNKKKGVMWSAIDVTEMHNLRKQLEYRAIHDALTGLHNRHALDYEMERAIARVQRNETTLAVCMLDLDDFKHINDTYGHDAGDILLKKVSERLKEALRSSDFLARLGGDEFVILLEDMKDKTLLTKILKKIEETISLPVQINQSVFVRVGVSIGVYLYTKGKDKEPGSILRFADMALYESKKNKAVRKNCWTVYNR